MTNPSPAQVLSDVEKCVDAVIAKVGKNIILGMPLGLGKPTHFVNAIYQRARKNPDLNLKIVTALSLERPVGKSTLEKNFLDPFVARQFEGVPDLEYAVDLRKGKLPPNVEVKEFYFKAGSYIHVPYAQQRYISSNYTHVSRDLMHLGVNVVAQMLAVRKTDTGARYSLSCNADLSLDLEPMLRKRESEGVPVAIVGEVNRELPFMYNDADVGPERFDFVIDHSRYDHTLFAAPNVPVAPADHLIGFYASTLVKDGGTLQVGIGSLGSALIYSTLLRHQNNDQYRGLMNLLKVEEKFPIVRELGGSAPFEKGLYGCSEMMVDGFLHLYKAGVLKRAVYPDTELQALLNDGKISENVSIAMLSRLVQEGVIKPTLRAKDVDLLIAWGVLTEAVSYRGGSLIVGRDTCEADLARQDVLDWIAERCLGDRLRGGIVMHGGFYLGPKIMYDMLRDFSAEDHARFCMTSVNFINHLYNHFLGDQRLKESQRQHARFINSAMMVTLNGGTVSDGLANGQVVSGVGGQYNFVSMAHELPGARSILKFKSTRMAGGKLVSNVVFNYGHLTIPRHLRDIFITEYGIADVRGRSDEEVIAALIQIADSRFQDQLVAQAKAAGKLSADYVVPEIFRNNTPEALAAALEPGQKLGHFGAFPFGCDFTDEELKIGKALKRLKAVTGSRAGLIKAILAAVRHGHPTPDVMPLLARMKMEHAEGLKEKLEQRLLVCALSGKI